MKMLKKYNSNAVTVRIRNFILVFILLISGGIETEVCKNCTFSAFLWLFVRINRILPSLESTAIVFGDGTVGISFPSSP